MNYIKYFMLIMLIQTNLPVLTIMVPVVHPEALTKKKINIALQNSSQEIKIAIKTSNQSYTSIGPVLHDVTLSTAHPNNSFSVPEKAPCITFISGHCLPPPALGCTGPQERKEILPVKTVIISVTFNIQNNAQEHAYNCYDYNIAYADIEQNQPNTLIIDMKSNKPNATFNGKPIKPNGFNNVTVPIHKPTKQQQLEIMVAQLKNDLLTQTHICFSILDNIRSKTVQHQDGPLLQDPSLQQKFYADKEIKALNTEIKSLHALLKQQETIRKNLEKKLKIYKFGPITF